MTEIEDVIAQGKSVINAHFGVVDDLGGGNFSFQQGSIFCKVRVWQADEDAPVFVRLRIPLLTDVKDTPELHRHIAFHSDDYLFGRLSLHEGEVEGDGVVDVTFTHTFIGGHHTDDELMNGIASVLFSADSLDEQLVKQFGGKRWSDVIDET